MDHWISLPLIFYDPLVSSMQGPFRHYVLNVLWIFINVLCVCLTMYHLYKLYKDLSQSNLESI